MIFLGLLCLVAGVLAKPSVYVSKTTYDTAYPKYAYFPYLHGLIPEKIEESKKLISGVPPLSPLLFYTSPILLDPEELKDEEEPKKEIEANKEGEEELEKDESLDEKPMEEKPTEDEVKRELLFYASPLRMANAELPENMVVRLKPPQYITDFIHSLPISFPDLPIFGTIFNKPAAAAPEPVPVPVAIAPPAEALKYQIAYAPVLK